MKLPDLRRWAPPGYSVEAEKRLFLLGLAAAAVFSLGFPVRYINARGMLYGWVNGVYGLRAQPMESFPALLGGALWGFPVLAALMLLLIALRYAYYYQGSRSIYLMRRLPRRFERHRRCLVLPLIAALACLFAALVLLAVYYGVYMVATPPECLPPDQWRELWRSLLS